MESKKKENQTLLGTDSKLLQEFKRDPRKALQDSGLSPHQQSAIEKGDALEIRRALLTEIPEKLRDVAFEWVVVIVMITPPPPPPE